MLQISIIGALGADAQVRIANGKNFVSFNVATNERYTKSDGTTVETTTWVNCTLPGDGGNLLQYLRKGTLVYCSGHGSARVYSSPKEKAMVAGIDCRVDMLELVGGKSDAVPSQLADDAGLLHDVSKCYHIRDFKSETLAVKKGELRQLYGVRGGTFLMDSLGFVVPEAAVQAPAATEANNNSSSIENGK